MSNRFPLIIDSSTNRILELPATDNLDLTGSNISNVNNIFSSANVNASFFNGNGSALTGVISAPAGSNTQIQYNNAGSSAGSANLTFNNTNNTLSVTTVSATTLTGTLSTAAQPNITSLGTLSSVSVTGTANIGNLQLTQFEETVPASTNTSTSIAPNLANGTIVRYTANSNFTFNGFTSPVAGQSGTVIITQDATGSRTLTSTMKFAGGSKTLSTAAGSIDIISVFYDGSVYYASLTKGYA